ncbi:hypothetical protein DPMN_072807 [Dreissena polymorpha]|uniref:Uncharacterized protein n=1 Tax=Dreissena polymorpha TaxID=45954 RepID=A0A9D4BXY2_DREPO|nr:hypothetical protein DPMN_072807 [Dreissena polymorpha]
MSKVLCYSSIDIEARSMRNNPVFYGIIERQSNNYGDNQLILSFLQNELDIDTDEICIERAHKLGKSSQHAYREGIDQKRPLIARFRDYCDTETIMRKVYNLKNSRFGIDRQYPISIASARSTL